MGIFRQCFQAEVKLYLIKYVENNAKKCQKRSLIGQEKSEHWQIALLLLNKMQYVFYEN